MPAALHWNAAVQVASEGCGWGDSFGPPTVAGGIVTTGHGGRGFRIGHGHDDHCITGGTWAHIWQTRGP